MKGITDAELATLSPEIIKLFLDLSPADRMELLAQIVLYAESHCTDSENLT